MDDEQVLRADRKRLEAMIDAAFLQTESEGRTAAQRRTILIDGFNVLHAVLEEPERKSGWWRRTQRERLLALAAGWPDAGDALWVAFDGARPSWSLWAEPVARVESRSFADEKGGQLPGASPRRGPLVHSVYVESADDWIVRRARRAADPSRTFVVTRDRQVEGRARSAGCHVWSPWAFLSECPTEPKPPLDESSGG